MTDYKYRGGGVYPEVLERSYLTWILGWKITLGQNKRTPLPHSHMKCVDEISLVKSLNLKQCLVTNPYPVCPVTYPDHKHLLLPSTTRDMQSELDRLNAHNQEHHMKINHNKIKLLKCQNQLLYFKMKIISVRLYYLD